MLSFYLKWHINKKLEKMYKNPSEEHKRQWNFYEVVERLKSIRIQQVEIGNTLSYQVKSSLDEEQQDIVSALGVTLLAKLTKA